MNSSFYYFKNKMKILLDQMGQAVLSSLLRRIHNNGFTLLESITVVQFLAI
jgi:hypothetical protein